MILKLWFQNHQHFTWVTNSMESMHHLCLKMSQLCQLPKTSTWFLLFWSLFYCYNFIWGHIFIKWSVWKPFKLFKAFTLSEWLQHQLQLQCWIRWMSSSTQLVVMKMQNCFMDHFKISTHVQWESCHRNLMQSTWNNSSYWMSIFHSSQSF